MIRLKIPTTLRRATNGVAVVNVDAVTVREALQAAIDLYPDLGPGLLNEAGELRRFLNVFVDEDDIRFDNGMDTPLRSGQTVSVLTAVAGGAGSRADAPRPRAV